MRMLPASQSFNLGNHAGPAPFKLGRYLRFDWNDIVAWVERQKNNGNGKVSLD